MVLPTKGYPLFSARRFPRLSPWSRTQRRNFVFKNKSIAIVIPAKNEANNIIRVLSSLPDWVDRAYVIDDGSDDGMGDLIRRHYPAEDRVVIIRHEKSRGKGGAMAAGYVRARDDGMDCIVVMDGDGQMDPGDLPALVEPIAAGWVDYCKGNRFAYPQGISKIPPVRLFGNFILSFLTKVASGYWHITDSQTGYTAITHEALSAIDAEGIYPSYGCPNDILIKLNIAGFRVGEVPVNPLYGVGEKSKMRIPRVILPILKLLFMGWVKRIVKRCAIMEGNPLVLEYAMALLLCGAGAFIAMYLVALYFVTAHISNTSLVALSMVSILCLQFTFSAMQADHESNRYRCVILQTKSDPMAKVLGRADKVEK